MDSSISELSSWFQGKTLFALHPVYQYLAKEYNLKIISEHWEPDQIPSEDHWAEFLKKLINNPSTIMLWEDDPLPEVRAKLDEMGIQVVY